ncbi:MAG: hypothetical protein KME64_30625 [Scytonematopsis contorta HA4267-MV1]|jgi:hypothetical protein|nr:hypothetical protein [Scytonematopsis contorta HA4267-MV1]
MMKSFSLKKVLERLQQVSPSQVVTPIKKSLVLLRKIPTPMLLLSIAAHGLLLFAIGISYSVKQKQQPQKLIPANPEPLNLTTIKPGESLFNPATSLVPSKNPVQANPNPLLVSQLPKVPTVTSTGITQTPPPPPPVLPTATANQTPPIPVVPTATANQTPPIPVVPTATQTSSTTPESNTSEASAPPIPSSHKRTNAAQKPQQRKKTPVATSTSNTEPKPNKNTDTQTTEVTEISLEKPSPETQKNPIPEDNSNNNSDNNSTSEANSDSSPATKLPEYRTTQPGSFNLFTGELDKQSLQTEDKLDEVVAFFEKELPDAGYDIKKLTNESDAKVYQISKGGQTQYLHLFEQSGKGTVIIFSDKQIERKSQTNVSKDVPEENTFDNTLKAINEELALTENTNFTEPDKFTTSVPGFKKVLGTAEGKTPDELAQLVNKKLEAQGFKVSQVNTYSNGPVFQVKKGAFTQFINFVPAAEDMGTIIILWDKAP